MSRAAEEPLSPRAAAASAAGGASLSPYSQIPAALSRSFHGLRTVPFRAFVPVLKLNDAGKLQERLLIATDEVVFIATSDGQIRRGAPLEGLQELYWHKEQRLLVLVFPTQYDICIKLDPSYTPMGKDAAVRALAPQLAALSDDWPRLAVLIGRLRDRRVREAELALLSASTLALPASPLSSPRDAAAAAAAPPTRLVRYTAAVGHAANRAFRLKKPDGHFQAVMRTGSQSSMVALSEQEIVAKVEALLAAEEATAAASASPALKNSLMSLMTGVSLPQPADAPPGVLPCSVDDDALASSQTMSTIPVPRHQASAPPTMSPIRWTSVVGGDATPSPRGHFEYVAPAAFTAAAAPAPAAAVQPVHTVAAPSVSPPNAAGSVPLGRPRTASVVSEGGVTAVPSISMAQREYHQPAARAGADLDYGGGGANLAAASNAGRPPVATAASTDLPTASTSPVPARPMPMPLLPLADAAATPRQLSTAAAAAAPIPTARSSSPSHAVPPAAALRIALSPDLPPASPSPSSSSLRYPQPSSIVPDHSAARVELMAPAGHGTITVANSSACSSIVHFVLEVEKERDWFMAQAEAAGAEVERLRAELASARMEVSWYRQRFLSSSKQP